MIDEDPVIVRLNVSHYRSLLQLDRLTEGERTTVGNLLAECEAQLVATAPQAELASPNVA
jgi:hypothetical protein